MEVKFLIQFTMSYIQQIREIFSGNKAYPREENFHPGYYTSSPVTVWLWWKANSHVNYVVNVGTHDQLCLSIGVSLTTIGSVCMTAAHIRIINLFK